MTAPVAVAEVEQVAVSLAVDHTGWARRDSLQVAEKSGGRQACDDVVLGIVLTAPVEDWVALVVVVEVLCSRGDHRD